MRRNRCFTFCLVLLLAGTVGIVLRSGLDKGESAEESKLTIKQAVEGLKLAPVHATEKQKRSPDWKTMVAVPSEAKTRTEKDIAVDIIHLFGKSGHRENAERVHRVRVSELMEEIYLSYRRRSIDGLPLPQAAAVGDLSPDDEDLLRTLASVGKSDPKTIYELERKIEDYGLKMGCESVEQVFAIWLSGP